MKRAKRKKIRKNYANRKYDFEIGYLKASPCKICQKQDRFPKCFKGCVTIDEVQTRLADGISCSKSYSLVESFTLSVQQRDN